MSRKRSVGMRSTKEGISCLRPRKVYVVQQWQHQRHNNKHKHVSSLYLTMSVNVSSLPARVRFAYLSCFAEPYRILAYLNLVLSNLTLLILLFLIFFYLTLPYLILLYLSLIHI